MLFLVSKSATVPSFAEKECQSPSKKTLTENARLIAMSTCLEFASVRTILSCSPILIPACFKTAFVSECKVRNFVISSPSFMVTSLLKAETVKADVEPRPTIKNKDIILLICLFERLLNFFKVLKNIPPFRNLYVINTL